MAGAYGNVRMVTGIKADIGALAGLCHGAGQVIPGFPAVKKLAIMAYQRSWALRVLAAASGSHGGTRSAESGYRISRSCRLYRKARTRVS
jgi:hypothetical protein